MKKIFRWGSFSEELICKGIFITSLLIIFRLRNFNVIRISAYDTNAEQLILYTLRFYMNYLEPIVILVWLKFVCEFLYKSLKRN
jgi:hypothetical protein